MRSHPVCIRMLVRLSIASCCIFSLSLWTSSGSLWKGGAGLEGKCIRYHQRIREAGRGISTEVRNPSPDGSHQSQVASWCPVATKQIRNYCLSYCHRRDAPPSAREAEPAQRGIWATQMTSSVSDKLADYLFLHACIHRACIICTVPDNATSCRAPRKSDSIRSNWQPSLPMHLPHSGFDWRTLERTLRC